MPGFTNTPETFWARTEPQGACRVWTGAKDNYGYGRLWWEGRPVKAHRLAFFLRMGRWPDGILRHLCDNRPCVLHVVEGTQLENMSDAVRAGTHVSVSGAAKTHCVNGHEFTSENTGRQKAGRYCLTCKRDRNARST